MSSFDLMLMMIFYSVVAQKQSAGMETNWCRDGTGCLGVGGMDL